MSATWNNEETLTIAEKKLIASSMEGVEEANGPNTEDELLGAQLALMACEILQHAVNDESLEHWLTEDAMGYPRALQRYTYEIAKYFHTVPEAVTNCERWRDFIESFVEFVWETKSHIATLNYDTLLYGPFNDGVVVDGVTKRLCSGFNGVLLDGYTNGLGFDKENLLRHNIANKAFYMHLHGSPLFVDGNNGQARKLTRHELEINGGDSRSHIVLTHGQMKPTVIASSPVLRMYWDKLPLALEEAEEIIVFGYSGADEHLNKLVKEHRKETPLKVIERRHDEDRANYWSTRLGANAEVIPMDDILSFRNW
ncbi:SIR2 family protein [Lentibacter sp. XHP0401]|uniref:SIR2 family protein n=1 Tax=Lentibacter sp. XHP0401 TaxID=2984334 RepID=UPI0021E8A7FC|nr:hypothetical protein [Lentibacter sp. XHP0401]MCV2893530.1 hypothetical protein [Lentibacter sp. XHP0401]